MNYRQLIFSTLISLILTIFFASFFISSKLIVELEKTANDLQINPLILMGLPHALIFIFCLTVIFLILMIRDKSNNKFIRTIFDPVLLIIIFLGIVWGLLSIGIVFFTAFGGGGNVIFIILFFPGYFGILLGGGSIFSVPVSIALAIISLHYLFRFIKFILVRNN